MEKQFAITYFLCAKVTHSFACTSVKCILFENDTVVVLNTDVFSYIYISLCVY